MIKKIYTSIALACVLFIVPLSAQIRILTIGDSTMADYDEEKNKGEREMRGWAQMFPAFLTDDATLQNAAKNGRSSKSFYYEFWTSLRETIQPGDYVFIQFGHNDEKNQGKDSEGTDLKQRGTAAWGQYKEYLGKYITETRERGGTPILFTPIVRCLFDTLTNTVNDTGMHNLTELASNATIMNYPEAMRSLAIELDVKLIDMTLLTKKMVESYGASEARRIIYSKKDKTHLSSMGGLLYSQLAAKELQRQKILTNYLQFPSDLKAAVNKKNKKTDNEVVIPSDAVPSKITWPVSEKKAIVKYNTKLKGLNLSRKGGKYKLDVEGGKWPEGDIDLDAGRFFELEMQSPQDKDLYIRNLTLNMKAEGGKGMYCTVLISDDKSFSNSKSVISMVNLPVDKAFGFVYNKAVKINKGQSFYLRIYPWYKLAASNKYVVIDNIELDSYLK